MINAELLYTLTQAGGTYKELSVHHLPRQAGRATGAKLSVILRAFRELFSYQIRLINVLSSWPLKPVR